MIKAGLKVLRESEMLEYPRLVDASLVRSVLEGALAAR